MFLSSYDCNIMTYKDFLLKLRPLISHGVQKKVAVWINKDRTSASKKLSLRNPVPITVEEFLVIADHLGKDPAWFFIQEGSSYDAETNRLIGMAADILRSEDVGTKDALRRVIESLHKDLKSSLGLSNSSAS